MDKGISLPAARLLGLKGKEKLFKGIKDYIEAEIDYKMGKITVEQFLKAETAFELMVMSLEWHVE